MNGLKHYFRLTKFGFKPIAGLHVLHVAVTKVKR